MEKSWLLVARSEMRAELLKFLSESKIMTLPAKLAELRELLPPSIERYRLAPPRTAAAAACTVRLRNVAVNEILNEHMRREKWLPAKLLNENPLPTDAPDSCEISTRALIFAIAFFPGPINLLIQVHTRTHACAMSSALACIEQLSFGRCFEAS
jgi:hypothetical protein